MFKDIISNHKINLKNEDVLNFLKIRRRWPHSYPWGQPSVEIINNEGVNYNHFDLFKHDGFVNFDTFKSYYDEGFTALISNVLDLTAELRSLERKLTLGFGSPINANFYMSKGTKTQTASFPAHEHEYDVIVKQLHGSSDWLIGGGPLIAHKDDVIVIPKGTQHQVVTVPEERLSLTINFN